MCTLNGGCWLHNAISVHLDKILCAPGCIFKIAAVGRCGGATTSEAKMLGRQNVSQHPTFISTCFTFGKMQPVLIPKT